MPLYLITYLLLFWVPDVLLGIYFWRKMGRVSKQAFALCIAVMTVATFLMEFVYLKLDIWTFSEKIDPLLGIRLCGIPIEEFVFWFGASPLFILLYFLFDRFMPNHNRALPNHG